MTLYDHLKSISADELEKAIQGPPFKYSDPGQALQNLGSRCQEIPLLNATLSRYIYALKCEDGSFESRAKLKGIFLAIEALVSIAEAQRRPEDAQR